MSYNWCDKVVLITGAAGGIGEAVVREILQEGIKHVAVLDIEDTRGVALQNELNGKHGDSKVKFIKCDVTSEDQLAGAYKSITDEQGYIDVVVNNAGRINESNFAQTVQLNVTAVVSSSFKALELMRKDQGGRGGTVINVASVAALAQFPNLPLYFATKAAVLQFSMCIGLEEFYARTGVRVITMCYGCTETPILNKPTNCIDQRYDSTAQDFLRSFPVQDASVAAQRTVEAYKRGESGSVWLSIASKPVQDITAVVKEAYGKMTEAVFRDD